MAAALMSGPAWSQEPAGTGPSVSDMLLRWEANLREHLTALVGAVPRVPDEFARAFDIAARDVNAGRPGLVVGILAGLILFGYLVEWATRRALAGHAAHVPAEPVTLPGMHRSLLSEVPPLLMFAVASAGLFLIFDWQPLLRKIVLTFLAAFIAFRLVRTLTRAVVTSLELLPEGTDRPMLSPDFERRRSYWMGRVSVFAGILLFGWAFVSLMPHLGFSNEVRRLVAYAFGLGLLAVAIDVAWSAPRPVPRSRRQAVLLTLCLVGLWMIWVAGLVGLLWLGIYALLLPGLVAGVGRISQAYVGSFAGDSWTAAVAKVLIARGARALVIVAALAWLVAVTRFNLIALSDESMASRIVYGLFNAAVVLLIADLIWALAKSSIDYRLRLAQGGADTPEERARMSRLRTLLPILRNGLGVLILTITALTVLAGLGVQIGPLIAGAGIFGVAIGFGSQTLVKDVLSGVFYMLDDAFRVGEYIQSGSYKGTVESFSLRSVRLRHHRGAIFTVPFGELGAVQNMSRDWVMEKWTISVTYDTDIEKARKIIKKIGLELAEDPEFASSTLEPLKMQGVDDFGEFAIVLKLKLMTKPGEQFAIKRKAYVMIKKAFEENGIRIAVPTVEVAGSGAEGAEGAAVAQQLTRRRHAAQVASTAA